jgi:hypothetical protein
MAQHKQGELEHPAGGWVQKGSLYSYISRAESNAKTAHANLFMLHRVLIAHWHHIYLLPVPGTRCAGLLRFMATTALGCRCLFPTGE